MNKSFIIVLLIFLLPLGFYWSMTRDKSVTALPSVASNGAEVIKFSSPMCYECQELDKVFAEIYPEFANKISLKKVDVTKNDKSVKQLIKTYGVTLVPTCVFKNSQGVEVRKTEGLIQPQILRNYMKELLNG